MNLEDLSKPFPIEDVKFRIGSTYTKNGTTYGMALAYIDARAVMDRLDEVVGVANWRTEAPRREGTGWACGLSIRIGDEWVTKWDVGEDTQYEAFKGGWSDAFKRAAVHWGIGRYLYSAETDQKWYELNVAGKVSTFKTAPRLKGWAQPQRQNSTPAQPWTSDHESIDKFVEWLNTSFNATLADALPVLGVERLPDFKGSKQEAVALLTTAYNGDHSNG